MQTLTHRGFQVCFSRFSWFRRQSAENPHPNFAYSHMALDRAINSEPWFYHPLNEGYINMLPSLLEGIKEAIHIKCLAECLAYSRHPVNVGCSHCHHHHHCQYHYHHHHGVTLNVLHLHVHLFSPHLFLILTHSQSKAVSLFLIKIASRLQKHVRNVVSRHMTPISPLALE